MTGTKTTIVVTAVPILAVLMVFSVPVVTVFLCMNDCIERCSNGKNLDSCQEMCKTACTLPSDMAKAAKEAANKVTDAVDI